MVLQIVDTCKKDFLLSVLKAEKYKTDTYVFRLHYKLTTWLAILYSICYAYVQIGTPISCLSTNTNKDDEKLDPKVVNDFCWVHGTYSVTDNVTKALQIYAGVRPLTSPNEKIFYHQYYKWMYFYFAAMLILLYVPRHFWRFIEAGRMEHLAKRLSKTKLIRDAEIEKEEANLADHLFAHLGYHQKYAYGFLFCEFLNVVVASCLLLMWDLLSDQQLSVYGWSSFRFMRMPPLTRTDGLAKVFPLMGKCTFNLYGASGSIVTHDIMCVLPLNVVNERAAVFFWGYFIILITAGLAELVFRLMLILSKRLRASILSSASPLTPVEDIKLIVSRTAYGDWFVINQVSISLEPAIFRQVLVKYAGKLRDEKGEEKI